MPPKLLIPSILCTSDKSVRHHWMTSRSVSLKSTFLPIVFENATRKAEQRVLQLPPERRAASARVAGAHLDLAPPDECCDHGSLYRMWTSLKPYPLEIQFGSNQLRSQWFGIYFLLVAWLAVVTAGLGSEIVVGFVLMDMLVTSKNGFVAWHFAQARERLQTDAHACTRRHRIPTCLAH